MRGHVRKRGKRWAFVVDAGKDEEGKRRQKWHSGYGTRRDAERSLAEALKMLADGAYIEPSKVKVADFARQWLKSIRSTVRPSTHEAYRVMVEAHIIPRLGHRQVQQLTASQLNTMYADLLEGGRRNGKGGLSARTVKYVHSTVRKMLSDAVRRGELQRNVAEAADPPQMQEHREMRTWSAHELRAFLGYIEGERLYAGYLLAATTGMRRGEVLGLRWRDLDLDAARASVRQTLVCVNYVATFSTPKTNKGRRSVALDATTLAALRTHRIRQLEERIALGSGALADDDLVFSDVSGEPLHPGAFVRRFRQLVKGSGLPIIRFHDLRHTHATLALQAGIHPKVVSERLGHSTVSMTLDVYSHAVPAMEEQAAARVAAVVFGA